MRMRASSEVVDRREAIAAAHARRGDVEVSLVEHVKTPKAAARWGVPLSRFVHVTACHLSGGQCDTYLIK